MTFIISFIKAAAESPYKTLADVLSIFSMALISFTSWLELGGVYGLGFSIFIILYARMIYREWKSVWAVSADDMLKALEGIQDDYILELAKDVPEAVVAQGEEAVKWYKTGVLAAGYRKGVDEKTVLMYLVKEMDKGGK